MPNLTHTDDSGKAKMVDVGRKPDQQRFPPPTSPPVNEKDFIIVGVTVRVYAAKAVSKSRGGGDGAELSCSRCGAEVRGTDGDTKFLKGCQ